MSIPTRGARATRTQRVPVTERSVLSVKGKEPGFHYRIVNDQGDRVQQMLDAGYEIVEASAVQVGDKRINAVAAEGTKAQVSVGGGTKAFVMRQKQEWYDEDQTAKQARVNQSEEAVKNLPGFTGSVKVNRD